MLASALSATMLAGWSTGCSLRPKVVPSPLTSTLQLPTPDGRTTDVSVWRPAKRKVGTVLFSHGWGGSPAGCLRIIQPLVASGWHVLAPLHTDSNIHPDKERYSFADSWPNRINDMRALSEHIGDLLYLAVGHSYGALTALVLCGAQTKVPESLAAPLRDPKAKAAIAFSPPLSLTGFIDVEGWSKLATPALIQTGTMDNPSFEGVSDETWEDRLVAYEAPPAGHDRYALVLEGVDHNFGGAIGSALRQPDVLQDRQMDVAMEIAVLFAQAHFLDKADARIRLDSRLTPDLPVRLTRR